MLELALQDFDIEQIANSGQCFRIHRTASDIWTARAFQKVLNIQKLDNGNYIFDCNESEFQDTWFEYFDLGLDYGKIKEEIRNLNDDYLTKAIEYGYGMRILKQDLWEMVVSYIISQRNSIQRISNTVEKLCAKFSGSFPSPFDLRDFKLEDFKTLGLGYRAEYIVEIVKSVLSGALNLESLRNMETEEVVEHLQNFKGIGPKVANCIALYGLHRIESFPIDTWIKRIIETKYKKRYQS